MTADITAYNQNLESAEREICDLLASVIDKKLPDAESKIWHRHPVWFLEGNPIVGYSKLKAGIRLMFWSGASFEEDRLQPGTGKFKDASVLYTSVDDVRPTELARWLKKSQAIQWDYKNVVKNKGKLNRLK
ncbi:hypothetical protein BH11PLA2_BH11PLA2_18570 [soil metagenome]